MDAEYSLGVQSVPELSLPVSCLMDSVTLASSSMPCR